MAAERFYIYRSGATDACALTRAKDDPRLPPPTAPDSWQFWMQIGRPQDDDSGYGFNLKAAVDDIAAKGYCLFTGTRKLLGGRFLESSAPSAQGGTSNA